MRGSRVRNCRAQVHTSFGREGWLIFFGFDGGVLTVLWITSFASSQSFFPSILRCHRSLFPLSPFLDPTNSTSPPPSAGDGDGSCADGILEAEDGSNFCDQLAANGMSDCGALAEYGFAQEDIDLVESVCVATCGICTSTGTETDTCVRFPRGHHPRKLVQEMYMRS